MAVWQRGERSFHLVVLPQQLCGCTTVLVMTTSKEVIASACATTYEYKINVSNSVQSYYEVPSTVFSNKHRIIGRSWLAR